MERSTTIFGECLAPDGWASGPAIRVGDGLRPITNSRTEYKHPWILQNHHEIFRRIGDRIRSVETSQYQITRWIGRTLELQKNSIIRNEYCNIKDGIPLLIRSTQFSYNQYPIRVLLTTSEDYDDDAEEAYTLTEVRRVMSILRSNGDYDFLTSNVEVREYEDRYEEDITEAYSGYDSHPEVIRRTVWKRDLFREEFHTIPFKPIHLEMLYSPDLPLWYKNRCSEAKEHFDSLL